MGIIIGLAAVVLIVWVLADGFEAMVLPRRVTRTFRPARMFLRWSWAVWRRTACLFPARRRRQTFLSVFGPLALLGLFGLWVSLLITGFALLQMALGTPLQGAAGPGSLIDYFYLSGVTFVTLGYGDVTPTSSVGQALAILEAGVGLAFLAIVISYLPVLYQAFSRREVTISLLDARAGSPPSAADFLVRLGPSPDGAALDPFLAEWERWAAELLESTLSYPVLGYYRSQHDNQSWVAALAMVLDVCALVLAGVKAPGRHQARLTFAMCRHAAVDIALVFHTPPLPPQPERMSPERLAKLCAVLRQAGFEPHEDAAAGARLSELRLMYEPFVNALANYFHLALPDLLREGPAVDNWQTSAWTRRTPGLAGLPLPERGDDHFD
jgi:hypothetical protein